MLTGLKIVAGNFSSYIGELSGVRSDWTEDYAADLVARINQTIDTHLGVDAKKDLREATSGVSSIQASARRDLSFFKTQIDDDFKSVPPPATKFLTRLGSPNTCVQFRKATRNP